MPGVILTSRSEYDAIRGYFGIDSVTLPDTTIEQVTFLPVAEADITKTIDDKIAGGCTTLRTVAEIMTLPAGSPDQVFLKAAVASYVAYLFSVGEPNAVNTGVALGEQEVDLGGVGAQWSDQGKIAQDQYAYWLSRISGWCTNTDLPVLIGGPTRGGYTVDTVSGFGFGLLRG